MRETVLNLKASSQKGNKLMLSGINLCMNPTMNAEMHGIRGDNIFLLSSLQSYSVLHDVPVHTANQHQISLKLLSIHARHIAVHNQYINYSCCCFSFLVKTQVLNLITWHVSQNTSFSPFLFFFFEVGEKHTDPLTLVYLHFTVRVHEYIAWQQYMYGRYTVQYLLSSTILLPLPTSNKLKKTE